MTTSSLIVSTHTRLSTSTVSSCLALGNNRLFQPVPPTRSGESTEFVGPTQTSTSPFKQEDQDDVGECHGAGEHKPVNDTQSNTESAHTASSDVAGHPWLAARQRWEDDFDGDDRRPQDSDDEDGTPACLWITSESISTQTRISTSWSTGTTLASRSVVTSIPVSSRYRDCPSASAVSMMAAMTEAGSISSGGPDTSARAAGVASQTRT